MNIIGIICEYNPFHNGHHYHIEKIKELYPNSLIILVLNGYFLERGEISIVSKETKTNIALEENIDIVIELPFIFGSNSADTFANAAVTILNHLKAEKIVFGSESNDVDLLKKIAKHQIEEDLSLEIKKQLKKGLNYPSALNSVLFSSVNTPNDLLGISYVKAIISNGYPIEPITIERTNNYHDTSSNENIISASNIREKIKLKENIDCYTKYANFIDNIDENLMFKLLKYKIVSDKNLSVYQTVDEGIQYKILKEINNVNSINDLILKIKSKRYTYNRLKRMFTHILIGLTKEDRERAEIDYIKILGFNSKGRTYLNKIKKSISIPLSRKISNNYLNQQYELIAASIYDIICSTKCLKYELNNKPIIKKDIDLE